MDVLRHGAENRVTAATLMNHVSSRSHTIFTLRLDQVRQQGCEGVDPSCRNDVIVA